MTLVICGLAFWLGALSEKIGGAVILGNVAITLGLGAIDLGPSAAVAQLALDGATAAALLFVLLRFGRPWLGVAMLLYAAQFALHSFYLVTERPNDTFHAMANNAIFLGVSLSLAAGVLGAVVRGRRSQGKA